MLTGMVHWVTLLVVPVRARDTRGEAAGRLPRVLRCSLRKGGAFKVPYVNVKLLGTLTAEQKRELAKRITVDLQEVAGKKPESTYVVIEEVPRTNWAVGGVLFSDK